MSQFTKNEIYNLLSRLEENKISPDTRVEGTHNSITLLHAVLSADLTRQETLELIKKFINLGCNVDTYADDTTPITKALNNDHIESASYMLNFHTFGHPSDLDILKNLSSTYNKQIFTEFLRSGKIDTNVTKYKGSHILHYLADTERFAPLIEILLAFAPKTQPNPIDRHGDSPLTIALNTNALNCVKALTENPNSKIIGYLANPTTVIDTETVDRYVGDFWKDFEKAGILEYSIKNNKEHLIPAVIRDVFLF